MARLIERTEGVLLSVLKRVEGCKDTLHLQQLSQSVVSLTQALATLRNIEG